MERTWNDQCDNCKQRRETQWGGQRENIEQLWQRMNSAIKAARVANKEQTFFARQVERAMQLDGASAQGAVEQSEDEAEMIQRLQSEYEMTKEMEAATRETNGILDLLNKESYGLMIWSWALASKQYSKEDAIVKIQAMTRVKVRGT